MVGDAPLRRGLGLLRWLTHLLTHLVSRLDAAAQQHKADAQDDERGHDDEPALLKLVYKRVRVRFLCVRPAGHPRTSCPPQAHLGTKPRARPARSGIRRDLANVIPGLDRGTLARIDAGEGSRLSWVDTNRPRCLLLVEGTHDRQARGKARPTASASTPALSAVRRADRP